MLGKKLRSFRIEEFLGSGTSGTVYRGVDEETGRPAAIKVARKPDAFGPYGFNRAFETLDRLRHPNVVRALGHGRDDGISYIATELISGPTLKELVATHGRLPWHDAVDIAIHICNVLGYIHERGVIHRNLKPSHFIFSGDGRLKLIGFGLAIDIKRRSLLAVSAPLAGTARYMAPEQICAKATSTSKSDLYSLGCVLYQLLTGQVPFEGQTVFAVMHGHLDVPPPRPSEEFSEIPETLDSVVVQLMAKDPADRPESAAEVAYVLSQIGIHDVTPSLNDALARSSPYRSWRWLSPSPPSHARRGGSRLHSRNNPMWDRELDA